MRGDVQVVSVCAEPRRRARIMVRCAQAGKHVYLDKPMAASSAEARQVVAAVREAGVLSHMFSQVRIPVASRLRQAIASSSVGELRGLHFDLIFAKGVPGTARIDAPRQESAQPTLFEALESKRELANVGVYPLTLLEQLLRRRVTKIACHTANYFFEEHQRNDMEDFAVALLELQGGLLASLFVGRAGWRSHPAGGLNRNYLVGAKGALCLDTHRPHAEVWSNDPAWEPPRRHPEDPMGFWSSSTQQAGGAPRQDWVLPPAAATDDVTFFLDCLQRGQPSDVSAEVGADVTRTLMAAYQSAASQSVVCL